MADYLLTSSSIPGHVNPLLEIGSDLVGRGHVVTFLVDPQYRDAVGRRGMRHRELPPSVTPRPHAPKAFGPRLWQRYVAGRQDMASVFVDPLAAQWDGLRRILEEGHVDAVLCDIAFTGVLPLLLSLRRRPRVVVCGVVPLMLSSRDAPPFGMAWHPQPSMDYRRMHQVVGSVLFRDVQSRFDNALRSVGAPKLPVFLTDWPILADQVLQLSIPELEYPRSDLPATVNFVGPVLPRHSVARVRPPQRRCAPTVVHVTQGTWDNRDVTELLVPTVEALRSRADTTVVVTTGRRSHVTLPTAASPNVLVTDFLPYDDLLPTVDVMVTNGGFGGVHHGLAYGIPLIIAGAASDKPEVAARVAYSGAGIDLKTARPRPVDIAAAVDEILQQGSYRAAARRLSREILRYNAFDDVARALADAGSWPAEASGGDVAACGVVSVR